MEKKFYDLANRQPQNNKQQKQVKPVKIVINISNQPVANAEHYSFTWIHHYHHYVGLLH